MAKLNKNFTSDIDKFFKEFDKKHPNPSKSQEQEIKKYLQIYQWRDFPQIEKT